MRNHISKAYFFNFSCLLIFFMLTAYSENAEAHAHISFYEEKITIHRNGSADIITVVDLSGYAGGGIALPLNYIWVEKISARFRENNVYLNAGIANVNGIDYLQVSFDKGQGNNKHLIVTYRDPAYLLWKKAGPGEHGVYSYKSEFQNTIPFVIDEFEMEVVLPEGFTIHKITKSKPEFTKKDPAPPFLYTNAKDGSHLMIRALKLGFGKSTSLEYTFIQKKTSFPLLIGGLILMGLLLFFFKDVLKERNHE